MDIRRVEHKECKGCRYQAPIIDEGRAYDRYGRSLIREKILTCKHYALCGRLMRELKEALREERGEYDGVDQRKRQKAERDGASEDQDSEICSRRHRCISRSRRVEGRTLRRGEENRSPRGHHTLGTD